MVPGPFPPPKDPDAGRIGEERNFERLFRRSPAPMTLTSVDTGRLLDVNDAWVRLTGYPREEQLGRTPVELGLVRAAAREAMMAKLLEAGGCLEGQPLELLTRAGETRNCLFSADLLPGPDGPRILGCQQDITAIQRQSDHLQRFTRLYACLGQINQAIVWSRTREALLDQVCETLVKAGPFQMAWIGWNDPATQEVRVVSQFGDTGGYLRDLRVRSDLSPLGLGGTGTAIRTGQPVVHNDILGAALTAPWHGPAAAAGLAASASFPIRQAGVVSGAMMVYAPVRDFFGAEELALLQDAAGDVSFALDHLDLDARRKAAEDGLQASEGRFRALIEQSPVAIAVARDGITRYVNAAFLDQFGLTDPAGLVGASILEFIAPEAREVILARTRRRALGLPVHPKVDTLGLRRDGSVFPMHMAVAVVQVPEGPETVFFLTDLTERVEAEVQRAALQAQLLQTQKMESLGSLAGGVAHDMNNVLAAILALASTHLTLEPGDSPAHKAFKTIGEAALRGGDLVKGLLNFARQSPSETRSLDLNLLLEEEARLLERTTLAKVRLVMDLAPDLRAIHGDPSALTHALMNLCVNAVDAMGDGGVLTLTTRNLGEDLVEVVVGDNGTGMSEAVRAKAIDPFFTTKEVGKGTGLGLAMVFNTVRAHQGTLELHSEPGAGTRVRLRFPAMAAPDMPFPAPSADPMPAPALSLAVLLVDDDELVLRATGMLVEVLGHTVTSATSGEEALAQVEAGARPDVVILDMNMPGLGGKGTLPRLLTLRPGLPVLLATGRADQGALDLVDAHPEVTLLSKPFTIEELQGRLARITRACGATRSSSGA